MAHPDVPAGREAGKMARGAAEEAGQGGCIWDDDTGVRKDGRANRRGSDYFGGSLKGFMLPK